MNLLKKTSLAFTLSLCCCFLSYAQSEFPGEHFSLEGAIELFLQSESPEDFEQRLNQDNNNVNNLDLNEDGQVDFIRVIDHVEGKAHAVVLQVPVSENESQDIATIEIEKTGNESAILQILGSEDIYGEEIIVEPFEEEMEGQDGRGPSGTNYYTTRVVVNVWTYPSVRYIYRPTYRPWVSPYRWKVYPRWWRPWRPVSWTVFQPRTKVWQKRCHVVRTHRVVNAHRVYVPRRTNSVTVKKRTAIVKTNRGVVKRSTTVANSKSGRKTTRKSVAGVQKNTHKGKAVKKTSKTRAVRKKNGQVKAAKTTKKKKVRKKGY